MVIRYTTSFFYKELDNGQAMCSLNCDVRTTNAAVTSAGRKCKPVYIPGFFTLHLRWLPPDDCVPAFKYLYCINCMLFWTALLTLWPHPKFNLWCPSWRQIVMCSESLPAVHVWSCHVEFVLFEAERRESWLTNKERSFSRRYLLPCSAFKMFTLSYHRSELPVLSVICHCSISIISWAYPSGTS